MCGTARQTSAGSMLPQCAVCRDMCYICGSLRIQMNYYRTRLFQWDCTGREIEWLQSLTKDGVEMTGAAAHPDAGALALISNQQQSELFSLIAVDHCTNSIVDCSPCSRSHGFQPATNSNSLQSTLQYCSQLQQHTAFQHAHPAAGVLAWW
jgi:hypothetical protein